MRAVRGGQDGAQRGSACTPPLATPKAQPLTIASCWVSDNVTGNGKGVPERLATVGTSEQSWVHGFQAMTVTWTLSGS